MDPLADVWVMCIYEDTGEDRNIFCFESRTNLIFNGLYSYESAQNFQIHQNSVFFATFNIMNTQINPYIIYNRSVAISLN